MKKILCLDFDGVIHSYQTVWRGEVCIPDPPVPGAIDFLYRALESFTVVIHSSRFSNPDALPAVRAWLIDYGVDPDMVSLEFPSKEPRDKKIYLSAFKPPASVTLDDRAITFDGHFPSNPTLMAFRPWNS